MTYVDDLRERAQRVGPPAGPFMPDPIVCDKHQSRSSPCSGCVAEEHDKEIKRMEDFFKAFGGHTIGVRTGTTVEELYGFFKLRMLQEMDPIFEELNERMRRYLDAAYNR